MLQKYYPAVKRLRISDSSLGLFKSCARKLEFAKFYRHSKRDESIPAEAGKALHAGFQTWLTSKDEEAAIFDMMLAYPVHLLRGGEKNDRPLEACYATLQTMMLSASFTEYEIATIKCLDGVERPAIEVPFEIEIIGFDLSDSDGSPISVSYIGYIDAILYHRIMRDFNVVDIKTHRNNLNDLTPAYANDTQCLPYGIVLENMLGRPVDSFNVTYISCYVDLMEPNCRLYPFPKSKIDIEDWAKGLLIDLQNIKLFANMGWFPRNGDACLNFKRPCKFFDICGSRDHEVLSKMILQGQKPVKEFEDEFKPWVKFQLRIAS